MHGDAVTQMRLSYDNRRLVTAGKDGSLCIWQVTSPSATALLPPPTPSSAVALAPTLEESAAAAFEYANEILITKSELEEKNRLVANLQNQVEETKTESEYQMRLKDNYYAEEQARAKKQSQLQASDLGSKIQRLENSLQVARNEHAGAVQKSKEEFERAMIESAEQYKSKLIVEYQKFETLNEKYRSLKKGYDKKLAGVEKAKEETIRKIKKDFDEKLRQKDIEVLRREKETEIKIK